MVTCWRWRSIFIIITLAVVVIIVIDTAKCQCFHNDKKSSSPPTNIEELFGRLAVLVIVFVGGTVVDIGGCYLLRRVCQV